MMKCYLLTADREEESYVLLLQEPHLCPKPLTQVSGRPRRGRQVLSHNLITGSDENRVSLGEGPPSAEEAAFLVKQ